MDPVSGKFIKDESRKYTLILAPDRMEDLKQLVGRIANSFDQEEVLLVVKGSDQSIKRNWASGLLKGHLWLP